ncbi:predicted protein [Chaetomium globosum CBS 148.51]|uniref:Uncharacterized protein n=1 Tax=Chaetomium globosum (strain ATCC 6205 / CBS 148.51 / DSM 1962 / NBRC 6347 / NRRL 1970) TaxID=306901 RepID=Q2GRM0_CHAGB|nr:uncharacterized protein CHGG_09384 [Chaetomium globosum CBS 148.51]EAQ85370.1 predicted protein [Chaetomium globosum CBS 148.51]
MPKEVQTKQALHLEVIHFAPGQMFSSRLLAERVFGLLLGPQYSEPTGSNQLAQIRERASVILSRIFDLCLARAATFAALDDWDLGWQIVAGDLAENYKCVMGAGELKELVTLFADARVRFLDSPRANRPHASPDKLANLIDRWLEATLHDAAAISPHPPASPSLLPARPAPLENLFAGFSLHTHGASPAAATAAGPTATDWPPSHLPAADRHLLDHFKVRAQLAGVCWDTKGEMPNLPDDKSPPLALRLFLGWLAAAHTPPPAATTTPTTAPPFALFAAPVAFADNRERQAWFRPSGCQSKLFGHVEGFLAYAADNFAAGKTMVLGLLTPVLRRFGAALMLRLVERGGVRGVQVVFFCPWDEHPWIKEQWRLQDWRLRLWKSAVLDAVDAWAAKHGVVIHEGYSSGSIRVPRDRDHDSVGMCAGWLLRVVTATQKTIPGDGEDEEWEWEETCHFRKLENWAKVEEDIEEDEKMEVDAET